MKLRKYIVAGLIGIVSLGSCTYLDKEPDTEINIDMVFENKTKLYRKIDFFYTGTIKTEANPQTLLHTSFNCYECPIFKECN